MLESHTGPPSEDSQAAGHELSEVSIRGIGWGMAALVLSMGLVFLITSWTQSRFAGVHAGREPPPHARAHLRQPPPRPRMLPDPRLDIEQLRAEEAEVLTTYGWTDRDNNVARIPIERAIELFGGQLPARQPQGTGGAP